MEAVEAVEAVAKAVEAVAKAVYVAAVQTSAAVGIQAVVTAAVGIQAAVEAARGTTTTVGGVTATAEVARRKAEMGRANSTRLTSSRSTSY